MKHITTILIAALVLSGFTVPAAAHDDDSCRIRFDRHMRFSDHDLCRDEVTLEMEDGAIILTCDEGKHEGETVELTRDGQLYIQGERIKLNRKQERLVREYVENYEAILQEAKDIGMQGARIGVKGAAVGIKAVAGVFKCAFSSFDTDDLERELERETRRLEKEAESLEELAEEIEDKVDDLKDRHEDLRDGIRDLDRLGWF